MSLVYGKKLVLILLLVNAVGVRCLEEVVVVASIDGNDIPLWLRGEDDEERALGLVREHDLSRRAVGYCGPGEATCVAELLRVEAVRVKESAKENQCELRIHQPRNGEVFVLGDVEVYPTITAHNTIIQRKSNYYVQAWVVEGGGALNEDIRLDPMWVNDSIIAFRLIPPNRRPGGGGTSKFPVRGVLNISLTTKACGGEWLRDQVSIVYRPFAEPDPPAEIFRRRDLFLLGHEREAQLAVATLLYNENNGYIHGALTLFQSVLEHRSKKIQMLALLGSGVSHHSRTALNGMGVSLYDLEPLEHIFAGRVPAAASALPGLGQGQWHKLALWALPYSRVLYLDADALVLTSAINDLFRLPSNALAAVNDYFAGAVLLVEPNNATSFTATLTQDNGFYVYGEQDFLNVHFAGSHLRLGPEFHCLAEDTAQLLLSSRNKMNTTTTIYDTLDSLRAFPCVILEFSSCARYHGGRPWKPWHGLSSLLQENPEPVCRFPPNSALLHFAQIWERTHIRALATLAARGYEPPPNHMSAS